MIHLIGVSTDGPVTIEDGNSALAFGDIDSNSNHRKPPFRNRFDWIQHFIIQTYSIVKRENAKAAQLA
jgi:hypothetical protein